MPQPDDPKTRPQVDIDDTEDRMGSVHELDFSERQDEREGRAGDERPAQEVAQEYPPRRVAESGMSGGEALSDSLHEDNVTLDDLSPTPSMTRPVPATPMNPVARAARRTRPCAVSRSARSAVASASMKPSWLAPRRSMASRGPTRCRRSTPMTMNEGADHDRATLCL